MKFAVIGPEVLCFLNSFYFPFVSFVSPCKSQQDRCSDVLQSTNTTPTTPFVLFVKLFLFYCRLLEEECQTDITFCVGNMLFKAHKAVLLARVPNFFLHVVGRHLNTCSNCEALNLEYLEPSELKTFLQ